MLGAAFLLALAAPSDGLPPHAGTPTTAFCHMGECRWFAEIGRQTLRETRAGRLIRIDLVDGTSVSAPGEEYEASWGPDASVVWDRQPHAEWVFCSRRLPAAIGEDENGRFYAEIFNFREVVPRNLEPSRRLYVYACHGPAADEIEDFAAHFRYRVPPVTELELARPEDIFDHLR